jgi:hypothetical protein
MLDTSVDRDDAATDVCHRHCVVLVISGMISGMISD